jgi:RHS repeat-associated protein
MSEWHVLDLGGDPTPGDPGRVRELAGRLRHQTTLIDHNVGRLRTAANGSGELHMEGDYAPKFREALAELPGELAKLGKAYQGCEGALSAYAECLEGAKAKAGTALRQGNEAFDRHEGALRELRALLPPDRQATFTTGLGPNNSLVEAAIADLDEGAKTQARAAALRARNAEGDRERARRLAQEAARLRGDGENRCAKDIRDALNRSGIKDKPWWKKAWDTVSKPFRSWDDFVNLCRTVALVAGVVALFISGPIGLALVAIALVAGAIIFADTLSKFARGEAGLGSLALDALGLIPGARGVLSVARLGRGALVMARGIGPASRALGGTLRNAGVRIAGGARAALKNTRQFARDFKCRFTELDPIDMASGEMILRQTDFTLPGLLDFALDRTYLSSYRVGRWFGPSWSSTVDQRLEVDPDGVCMVAPDGVLLAFPHPNDGETVVASEGPRFRLSRTDSGGYMVLDPETGRTSHFARLLGGPGLLPLAAITDRNGNRVEFSYGPDGVLTEIEHSGGYRLLVDTWDGLITGFRLRRPDSAALALISYAYDGRANLTEIINSSGTPLRFDYDTDGRMVQWTDRNGSEYRYTYDTLGRCIRTTGSAGCLNGTIRYEDGVTVETNSLGHDKTYHFNTSRQVERIVDPLGGVTTMTWDRYDRQLSTTDPLGRTTRQVRDDDGNVTAIILPDGSRFTAAYNALGLPVIVTDPDGAAWQYTYDSHGNLLTVTDPMGAVTSYTYDGRGHITSATDALGGVHRVESNPAGLPIAVTDPLAATTYYGYDAAGRVITITDPAGGVSRLSWTIEGKLASRTRPDTQAEHWSYDGEGNLVQYTDSLGQVTRSEIGHFDLLTARVDPDGSHLKFGYDTELRLAAVTNPQGLVWRYEYDPAGNLIRETDFNGRELHYAQDAAGQLIVRTNGAGQTITFVRDLLGNVRERQSAGSVATFDYDGAGRLLRTANADAEITFTRDALGRILAETCNGRTITSSFDKLGRRVRRSTPSGAESVWEYDGCGQPIALHTAGQTIRFGYDNAGREVERRLGDNVMLTQTWDTSHRLLSQALTAATRDPAAPRPAGEQQSMIQRRDYQYRADGYLTGIVDQLSGPRAFNLDPAGRVTAVQGQGWTERYAYDSAGNIISATWPTDDTETIGERVYAGTLIRRAGNVRYQHDAQGRVIMHQRKRLTAKPLTWHYTWDADDRLTDVTTPDGQRWCYRYDPLGRRVAKQRIEGDRVAEQVEFTWDGVVLAEQTQSTGKVTTWDWEPDSFRPVTQTERTALSDAPQRWIDEQFYSIITDLIGTPSELVDPHGTIAWHSRTTLLGTLLSSSATTAHIPLRFPGQYHDPETGLNYNYHRYYDPATGRYNTADPLGLTPSPNPHTYVQNPTRLVDPLGLMSCVVDAVISETIAARGNITSVHSLNANQALAAAERWLGPGYREMGKPGSGVYRNSEGTRQFRMDNNSLLGNHAPHVPHVHLETYLPGAKYPMTNNHIPLVE